MSNNFPRNQNKLVQKYLISAVGDRPGAPCGLCVSKKGHLTYGFFKKKKQMADNR